MEIRRTAREAFEQQHLESCGKQVSSTRPSQPTFTFGSPRRHILEAQASLRSRELCEHPSRGNPGPTYSPRPVEAISKTTVLRGWGQERRFLQDPAKTQAQMAHIQHSTNASPFSATYPYQEIPTPRSQPAQPLPVEDDPPRLQLPSPKDERRRAP